MKFSKGLMIAACILIYAPCFAQDIKITGQQEKWRMIALDIKGPAANSADNDPNPFLDYRLNVKFISPSGKTYTIPGFYSGDGQGANSGNTWTARFSPDETGNWKYEVSFRAGKEIAVNETQTGKPVQGDGRKGNFTVNGVAANAQGFYKTGRLQYVGKHYFKQADGGYWLKSGADEPEDMLAYTGFTNTPAATHTYSAHIQDWKDGDPDWENGKGKGIIGALNYLAAANVNSIYFMPMNIGGDGKNVWPFLGKVSKGGSPDNDNTHYDNLKLLQWETVFAHAQKIGLLLHVVLNEAEEKNKKELDNGELGVERKLYYREMVARFGHHPALQWNICEEYNLQWDLTPTRVKSFAAYIHSLDAYQHPLAVHHASTVEKAWPPFSGDKLFQVSSFQTRVIDCISIWREKSAQAGYPQVMSLDELYPDVANENNTQRYRREYIWPIYFSGGQVELILEDLLKTEDYRKYSKHWQTMWFARKFLEQNTPYWEMKRIDSVLKGETTYEGKNSIVYGKVFAKPGQVYAVYLPNGSTSAKLDMGNAKGDFELRWYDPSKGEFEGNAITIKGGGWVDLGLPPSSPENDWTILLTQKK